ncbi:MAG: DinB family protein [Candidatus Acidiferrales bacterium]
MGLPQRTEAAPFYFTYIDRITGDNILETMKAQLDDTAAFLGGITEERSLYRYAPDKWSIRQVVNHVNDTERVFAFRAMWFARGFIDPLPSFDQNVASNAAQADERSLASYSEEFRNIREATVSLFRNLPAEAWTRSGVASGNSVTVNALAYIIAGHVAHHMSILRERYLAS